MDEKKVNLNVHSNQNSSRGSIQQLLIDCKLEIELLQTIPNIQHNINNNFRRLWWSHVTYTKVSDIGYSKYYKSWSTKTFRQIFLKSLTKSLELINKQIVLISKEGLDYYESSGINHENISVGVCKSELYTNEEIISHILIPCDNPLHSAYKELFLQSCNNLQVYIMSLIKTGKTHNDLITNCHVIDQPSTHVLSNDLYTIIDFSDISMQIVYVGTKNKKHQPYISPPGPKDSYKNITTEYHNPISDTSGIERDISDKYKDLPNQLSDHYLETDIQSQILYTQNIQLRQHINNIRQRYISHINHLTHINREQEIQLQHLNTAYTQVVSEHKEVEKRLKYHTSFTQQDEVISPYTGDASVIDAGMLADYSPPSSIPSTIHSYEPSSSSSNNGSGSDSQRGKKEEHLSSTLPSGNLICSLCLNTCNNNNNNTSSSSSASSSISSSNTSSTSSGSSSSTSIDTIIPPTSSLPSI